jgi:hypothetical protein
MASPSKVVTRHYDQIALMASAAQRSADAVSAGLNMRLAGQLQGAEPGTIDWKAILDNLGQFLLEIGNVLVERDLEVQLTRRIENQLRDRRNQTVKKLKDELRSVRLLLDKVLGKERSLAVFPARKVLNSLDPRNLARVAREVVALLQGSGVAWPDPEQLKHLPNPAALVVALEASAAELESTLEELRPEKRGAEFALGTRQMDLDNSIDAMQRGADLLFGLFRFGGFDFAAERLRPRRRRAKGSGDEGPESPAPKLVPEAVELLPAPAAA